MKKTIVIIGAGSGISLSVARLFLSRGFCVALVSRNTDKLRALISGEEVSFFSADVTDETSIKTALGKIRKTYSTIDILHYNAAHIRKAGVFEDTPEQLVADFRVNVAGLLTCSQILRKDLTASGGALLITGGGIGIHPNPDYASLSSGKAALRNLSASLEAIFGAQGVYVGILTVNNYVTKTSALHHPDNIAAQFWNMYSDRKVFEVQL
ncbi:SDR family NAD(P)-dependent oxidoreductase [Sinomicrobium kalidii]|uniref:SDR family oxidoreductase n=1 Tax=Sinomicrobium kalidii TaxID=2900738 RepID=UPI001E28687D|nr:SDR family NAD(P)-dependent oxidoreductase [Sinomicrobium kalidii]UGU15556.1 SDR family NAD(P)-dependent oxidoreductase [Sinomicrobium kalidii]